MQRGGDRREFWRSPHVNWKLCEHRLGDWQIAMSKNLVSEQLIANVDTLGRIEGLYAETFEVSYDGKCKLGYGYFHARQKKVGKRNALAIKQDAWQSSRVTTKLIRYGEIASRRIPHWSAT